MGDYQAVGIIGLRWDFFNNRLSLSLIITKKAQKIFARCPDAEKRPFVSNCKIGKVENKGWSFYGQ